MIDFDTYNYMFEQEPLEPEESSEESSEESREESIH